MVSMEALIRRNEGTLRMLDYDSSMHPISAQLYGSNPKLAGECAKILEDMGFDVIDLNCGCPVDKVTKDGYGSGLLKQIDLVGEIIASMKAAVKVPVTIKVRAGWDSQHIITEEITRIAEEAGATALCIHGRTRSQGYSGHANWEYIAQCKRVAKKMLIIGNGDIFDPLSAKDMFEKTGCDAIMLARGLLGKPWLIEDIYHYLLNCSVPDRPLSYYKNDLMEHLKYIMSYQDAKKALLEVRKVGCWYLKGGKGMSHLRCALNHAKSLEEAHEMISNYNETS